MTPWPKVNSGIEGLFVCGESGIANSDTYFSPKEVSYIHTFEINTTDMIPRTKKHNSFFSCGGGGYVATLVHIEALTFMSQIKFTRYCHVMDFLII